MYLERHFVRDDSRHGDIDDKLLRLRKQRLVGQTPRVDDDAQPLALAAPAHVAHADGRRTGAGGRVHAQVVVVERVAEAGLVNRGLEWEMQLSQYAAVDTVL